MGVVAIWGFVGGRRMAMCGGRWAVGGRFCVEVEIETGLRQRLITGERPRGKRPNARGNRGSRVVVLGLEKRRASIYMGCGERLAGGGGIWAVAYTAAGLGRCSAKPLITRMRSAALRRVLFRAASCVVVAGWAALRAFWAPSKTVRAALVSVGNAVA